MMGLRGSSSYGGRFMFFSDKGVCPLVRVTMTGYLSAAWVAVFV